MPTAYVGSRPVLKGRDGDDNINVYTGKVEQYSNWSIFNPSQVLDDGPDRHVTPGTGNEPNDYFMSYMWRGGQHIYPLKDPGLGPRIEDGRWHPYEYKGLVANRAFPSDFGHSPNRGYDYENWTNYFYTGVPSAQPMSGVGHAKRYESPVNSFGAFDPYINKGVTKAMAGTIGQALPTGNQNEYGHNRVLEWSGVPSGKAL